MKILFTILAVTATLLLSGCGLVPNKVNLNYQLPALSSSRPRSAKAVRIKVEPIKDARSVNNPNLIVSEDISGYFIKKIDFNASEPVSKVIQAAFKSGLQQLHYQVVNSGPYAYKLFGAIESIDWGLDGSLYRVEIQLKLALLNRNNKIVWSNVVFAYGQSKDVLPKSAIKDAFNNALTHIVRQVQNTKQVHAILNH